MHLTDADDGDTEIEYITNGIDDGDMWPFFEEKHRCESGADCVYHISTWEIP